MFVAGPDDGDVGQLCRMPWTSAPQHHVPGDKHAAGKLEHRFARLSLTDRGGSPYPIP
jgi:hypothetical protein